MHLTRRSLLLGGALAISAGSVAAASHITTFDCVHERIRIPLPKRAGISALAGLKIGFATDLHCGINVPRAFLAAQLELLLQDNPELFLWGGDYLAVNGSTLSRVTSNAAHHFSIESFRRADQLRPILAELPSLFQLASKEAPSLAVLGNHELWVAPDEIRRVLDGANTSLLVNETRVIHLRGKRIEVAGCDDLWNGIPQPPQFSDSADFKIFLCHNPDYVSVLERHGRVNFDLALCGHTHGGQMKLPGLGALSYNIGSRLTEGLFQLNTTQNSPINATNSNAYISRGLGVVEVPLRINCPAEVTSITLVEA